MSDDLLIAAVGRGIRRQPLSRNGAGGYTWIMGIFSGLFSTLIWLGLSYLVGKGAQNQNRSFLLWFAISLITTPLIGFLGILLLPRGGPSGYLEE